MNRNDNYCLFRFGLSALSKILFTELNFMEFIDKISHGPRQANLVLIAYTSSEGSGEPVHPRTLARTFSARSYKQ